MKSKLDFTADNGHLVAYAYADDGAYIDKGKSDVVIEYNSILPKQWASACAILYAVSCALGVDLEVDSVDDAKSSWEMVRGIVTEQLKILDQESADNMVVTSVTSAQIPPAESTIASGKSTGNTKMGFWGRSSRKLSLSGNFQRAANGNDEKRHLAKNP